MDREVPSNKYVRELLNDVKYFRHELGFIAQREESESITSIAVQLAIETRTQARHEEVYRKHFIKED